MTLSDNALVRTVKKHGIHNIHFKMKSRPINVIMGIGFTSSSDPEIEVMCEISEKEYSLEEGYKVTLQPFAPIFARENFYQSDLISLIRQGSIKMQDPDGRPIDLE